MSFLSLVRKRRVGLPAVAWILLALSTANLWVTLARADTFPSRPIRLVIGFAAGSATDSLARAYADKLANELKVTVVVDNKASGAQAAAIQALQMAPPDGYTLYIGTGSSMAQGPGLRKDVRHDPLRDFTLIGHLATAPGALIVNAELPFKTVDDLVAYGKANPGKLNFGSSGVGAAGHLSGELFMARTGVKMLHIPYKADTEATREVAAGNLQLAFTTLRTAASVAGAGKVRVLLTLDTKRSPLLPDVPCVTEVSVANLKDIAPYTWYALVGPTKMPQSVVTRLSEASARAVAQPDYIGAMHNAGVHPESSTPEGLRVIVSRELTKWRNVAKTVKIDF